MNQTIVDPSKYQLRVLVAAMIGYGFDAIDIMIIALAMPLILREWGITMVQGGIVVTAMLTGSVIGGYVFGPIADKYGRKKALVWCIGFFGLTTGLAGLSQNYVQLAALRFLAGLGLGAEWALGATMVAEFTSPEKRGRYNSLMQMGWPLGYIPILLVMYTLVPKYGWRILYYFGGLAVLVAVYIQVAIPESPVWLKAQELKKSGGAQAAAVGAKATDLFKQEHIKSFIYVTVMCISALICYWGVNSWLPTILVREKGMDTKGVSQFLTILTLASIPVYATAAIVIDKLGKRYAISIAAVLAAITLYIWLGFTWGRSGFLVNGILSWVTASFMWAGFGAYIAEQFPTNVRAVAVSVSFSTGRAVTVFVPMVLGAAATATASMTTVIAFISVFYLLTGFMAFMLRENKGSL